NLRYALSSVKGVAEVAPVGGFVKQYQVDLDPNALVAYNIPLSEVVNAIKLSNADVGGKVFEVATTEYYIRGRGYIKKIEDIENIVLKVENGTPVYLKNVGNVHLGADIRRGVAELDGKGETVGGIVVMRYGENALNVIDGVKKKIAEIKSSLPEGVRIVPTYDRSDLIKGAKGVGRALFFALLVITVSFIPVFSLTAQEGRLFRPLAFTKTFAMFFAAFLGVTLVPVLMTLLIRGKITPEEKNPVNRFLIRA